MPIRSCRTCMRRWPRRSGGSYRNGRRQCWRLRRQKGRFWVIRATWSKQGHLGRAALMEGAEDLAQRLAPALRAVRSEGVNTLRGMADALNRRGIKSSRGGVWHPSSVANLLSQSPAFYRREIRCPFFRRCVYRPTSAPDLSATSLAGCASYGGVRSNRRPFRSIAPGRAGIGEGDR